MKRIYVAGSYSADNVLDVLKNIGRGESYCAKLFMMGFAPFNPWADREYVFQNWDKEFTVEMFYDYSIKWLEVSDAVFLVPGWNSSKGVALELKKAEELHIPIFMDFESLLQWGRENKQ